MDTQSGSMFEQLESLMTVMKKEANNIETLKCQIQELELSKKQLEETLSDAYTQNQQQEGVITQLSQDLKNLNQVCNEERKVNIDLQRTNISQQQEIVRLQQEIAIQGQKYNEQNKLNQALTSQIQLLDSKFDEEKKSLQSSVNALELNLLESERQKTEISTHFWRITEESNTMKRKIQLQEENQLALEETIEKADYRLREFHEIALMSNEDIYGNKIQISSTKTHLIEQMKDLQFKYESLVDKYSNLEEIKISLETSLSTIHSENQINTDKLTKHINELSNKLTAISKHYRVVESDKDSFKKKYESLESNYENAKIDLEKITNEKRQLEVSLCDLEGELKKREDSLQQSEDSKRDLMSQLASVTSNYQALETQARDEQTFHWNELQRLKNLELQLTEENSRLLSELEDRCCQLDAAQKDRDALNQGARAEIERLTGISNALRAELEKRLPELTATIQERDSLKMEGEELKKSIAALQKQLITTEQSHKSTREQEMSRLQHEVRARTTKIRALELDKEDLLRETSALVQQNQELLKSQLSLQSVVKEMSASLEEMRSSLHQYENSRHDSSRLVEDAMKRESDLRQQITSMERSHAEEVTRLEGLVKNAKKTSAQQVADVSTQIKGLTDEIEALKNRNQELVEGERRALQDTERLRSELQFSKSAQNDIQQQMAQDMNLLRRDVQEARMQAQTALDAKERAEAEAITARNEVVKIEKEKARLQESNTELTYRMQQTEQAAMRSKAELDAQGSETTRLRNRVTELEIMVAKQIDKINLLNQNLNNAGVDERQEGNRLRQQLEGALQELNQHRASNQRLHREAEDAKSAYSRLQATTNVTMTGLLSELKSSESALTDERKRNAEDNSLHQEEILRLRQNLENSKAAVEEARARARRDREEKDSQINQLENDLEKVKSSLLMKESRLGELESQRQKDREKLHDLLEKLAISEQSRAECEMALHNERLVRRKLERESHAAATAAAATTSPSAMRSPLMFSSDKYEDGNDWQLHSGAFSMKGSALSSPVDRPFVATEPTVDIPRIQRNFSDDVPVVNIASVHSSYRDRPVDGAVRYDALSSTGLGEEADTEDYVRIQGNGLLQSAAFLTQESPALVTTNDGPTPGADVNFSSGQAKYLSPSNKSDEHDDEDDDVGNSYFRQVGQATNQSDLTDTNAVLQSIQRTQEYLRRRAQANVEGSEVPKNDKEDRKKRIGSTRQTLSADSVLDMKTATQQHLVGRAEHGNNCNRRLSTGGAARGIAAAAAAAAPEDQENKKKSGRGKKNNASEARKSHGESKVVERVGQEKGLEGSVSLPLINNPNRR